MKRRITYPSLVYFGMILPLFSHSQTSDCSISTTYLNQVMLELNLNGGITSYFGDLSLYDMAPLDKVTYESLPGYGAIATLQITKTFGISGQVLQANLKATMDTVSFKTQLFEYNIHGRVDFLNLFGIRHNSDFGFEGYAGIGQFFYSVDKETTYSQSIDKTKYTANTPEFVYFLGGGLSYHTSKYTTITLDIALRQCQTDRLDDYSAHGDFDYYSYLSLGITIEVGRLINPYLKTKYALK